MAESTNRESGAPASFIFREYALPVLFILLTSPFNLRLASFF